MDTFAQNNLLSGWVWFINVIFILGLIWKKKYLRSVTFNPFNILTTISANQEIICFISEVTMFLVVFFDNDPFSKTEFSFTMSFIFSVLLFLSKSVSPNLVFQNMFAHEMFWANTFFFFMTMKAFMFRIDEDIDGNLDNNINVLFKASMAFLGSYFISTRYARWYFDFQELNLGKILGTVSKGNGIGSFGGIYSGPSFLRKNTALSENRFTL
jgi:hypothetical protein